MAGKFGNYFLGLLVVLLPYQLFAQCNLIEITLDTKIEKSALVFEGKVIDKKSFYNTQHTFIYTRNTIQIYKLFKGAVSSKTIDIITEGGTMGDTMLTATASANLKIGDVGILMAEPLKIISPDNLATSAYKFYGDIQGFFNYNLKNKTASVPFKNYTDIKNQLYNTIIKKVGKPYTNIKIFELDSVNLSAINPRSVTLITSFSPSVTTAGTNSVLTIKGSGFGSIRGNSTVNFSNADDGGRTFIQPDTTQYISWSDVTIKVIVPSNAGTGPIQIDASSLATSINTLTITYAELNVQQNNYAYETNMVALNAQGGVTWRLSGNMDTNATAKTAVIKAMLNWSCNTFVNWELGPVTEIDKALNDSVSVITFDAQASLSEGTLGTCYNYWYLSQTSKWVAAEMDIVVNPDINWHYNSSTPPSSREYDFESVIAHEFGHGLQCAHVIDTNNIMHYGIHSGQTRTLNAINFAAGDDVLSRSTSNYFINYNVMTLLDSANCNDLYAVNVQNNYMIFPNPSDGYISMAIPQNNQNLTINCYNLYGAKLKTINTYNTSNYISIDLSDLGDGMYILLIDDGKKVAKEKMIVEKN